VDAAVTCIPAVIDYSSAAELADAVRAFAMIESAEDGRCVGDDGCAFGLLQMHPATFKRYYGCVSGRFEPDVGDTWTTAQIKACAAHLYAHRWGSASQEMRELVVQAWNLGESAVFLKKERNLQYLKRWQEAYAQITERRAVGGEPIAKKDG
jgi:hypothetical protein